MSLSRRRRAVLAAAAGAILGVGAAVALWLAGPRVQAYEVKRGELVQTIVASGRVESPRRIEIGSPVVGTVAAVPVTEGQAVAKGQLLVQLDDSEARAAVASAQSSVAQAEARLVQLDRTGGPVAVEAMRQAQANLDNAERQYQRNHDLFSRGFVGQATLDDAQRTRDVAASQLDAAKLQSASLSAKGADYAVARSALAQARAALAAAQAHLDLMTIEAPVAGTLISRSVEAGSVAQPGKVLLVLSPAGETQLTVQIDEKNLNYLKLNQKALASADAYPDQRFACEVVYINPGIDASRGSVEVKLTVPSPPAYLLQDMTVSVDIEVAKRPDALSVPLEAVRDAAGTKPWVMVVADGRAQRRNVKLGMRGGSGRVEVVDGLAPGDRVIPSTEAVRPGRRVRAA